MLRSLQEGFRLAPHEDSDTQKPQKLRRLGQLADHDIKQCMEESKPTPREVKNKYSMDDDYPEFMCTMAEVAQQADPPIYASQGQDVGKVRGRKAKVGKKDKKGGKRSKAPKKKKAAPKKVKATGVGKFKKLRRRQPKSAQRAPALPKEPEPLADDEERPQATDMEPEHHGPRRLPPPHVTANHVYTSAYRRNLRQGSEYARLAGRLAAASFREGGWVDDLCGVFRTTKRRANRTKGDGEHSEKSDG